MSFNFSGEIHHGDSRGRDAQGIAVELALQIRDDQSNGFGGAGGGRDDIQPGRAGAAQIGMRHIQYLLVIGVGVNGGHESAFDLVLIMHDFRRRGQAVRGAGGVRDHVVDLRVVLVFVDAQHYGQVFAFRRERK